MTFMSHDKTGVNFSNIVPEDENHFFFEFNYVYNGGGVALGDLDNDGLADIYFTGNRVADKLYKNQGDFRFSDETQSAGVNTLGGWKNGVTLVDINQDGLLDIYVCKGGFKDRDNRNILFVNKGDLKFENEAKKYGLDDAGFSTHANFFDADNDGDLDVYILNRPEQWQLNTELILERSKNPPEGTSDHFYINNNGVYERKNSESGIGWNYAYSLSSSIIDINNDGLLDIYVANDFLTNDFLFVNKGDGQFEEKIRTHTNHNSFYSMGSDVQDINNDGFEDLLVVEMLPKSYFDSKVKMVPMFGADRFDQLFNNGVFHHQYMHNTMNLNSGSGFLSDISSYSGLMKTDWSWACLLSDFDNDGYRDVFVANGYKRDVYDRDNNPKLKDTVRVLRANFKNKPAEIPSLQSILDGLLPTQKTANRIFRNKGDLRFEDTGADWTMQEKSLSNGAAVADLDNDGDLDLVINNIDEKAFVYRNDIPKGNCLRVKLNGPVGNRNGIGAMIELETGNGKMVERMKVIRGYLSSCEPIAHFGLGEGNQVKIARVTWPDGKVTVIDQIELNKVLDINYSEAVRKEVREEKHPFFEDATQELIKSEWVHKENYFRDFERQILLPHRQSMHGPLISVADANGDGLEDFYISGAYDQAGALFVQNANGQFRPKKNAAFEKDKKYEDLGSDFFDMDGDGDLDLYVVSGGMEHSLRSDGYQDRIYLNDGRGNFSPQSGLPQMNISGSVAKSIDLDNNGKEEIFVGGRHLPFNYPKPVHSMVFSNKDEMMIDLNNTHFEGLDFLGMVTDATWSDMNNDGFPELIVVGEWMPITIFAHKDGKFRNLTSDLGMDKTNGWWFSVVSADLDNDGDQDLICGNIGLNYKFKASLDKPFEVFADDFDGSGTYDIFLAKRLEDERLVPIRGRDCTSEQMPVVGERFPTFREFAKGDIFDLLDNDTLDATRLKAYDFASVIIENLGGTFKRHELPPQAQFSAVRGIVVDDYTGDGIMDILIAGNMFQSEAETTRADASVGLLLKGLGNFQYESIPSNVSGIHLPYDVRDLKPVKLGAGGKKGVLVAINNMAPKVLTLTSENEI